MPVQASAGGTAGRLRCPHEITVNGWTRGGLGRRNAALLIQDAVAPCRCLAPSGGGGSDSAAGIVARSVTVADAVESACWGIAVGSLLSGEVTQCA